MEGGNRNKKDRTALWLDRDPDEPLPSIERSESRSPDDFIAPTIPARSNVPTRGRGQQRGGRARGARGHHLRTSSNTQVPLVERRGNSPSYAAHLSEFLGPLRPLAQQQMVNDPVPARRSNQGLTSNPSPRSTGVGNWELSPQPPIRPPVQNRLANNPAPARRSTQGPASNPHSTGMGNWDLPFQSPNGRPTSRHVVKRGIGRLPGQPSPRNIGRMPGQVHPRDRQQPYSYQVPDRTSTSRGVAEAQRSSAYPHDFQQQPLSSSGPAFRPNYTPVPPQNFHYTGPVNFNPLTLALDPNNTGTLNYPTQLRSFRERVQSQSDIPNPGHEPTAQQIDSHQASMQADDNVSGIRDAVSASQASENPTITTGTSGVIPGSFGVLVPPRKKRGRPLGSKTKNKNTRIMQPLSEQTILPGPSTRTPLPSSAVPVPQSQKTTIFRPSHGTTFSIAKNAHAMLNPFTKIIPATIKLVSDDEEFWEYKYPGTRRNWRQGTTKVTVKKLNDWANTILRRRLPDNFAAAASKRSKTKPEKWTEWERAHLEATIMATIKVKRGILEEDEWKSIADAQNDEFLGCKRLPGLPLARMTSRSLTIDNVPADRGGGSIKTEGVFPGRSSSEIQSMLYRWPDIQERIKTEIKRHRGKVPSFLDCDTDLSSSDMEEIDDDDDDEEEVEDTIMVDDDGKGVAAGEESDVGSLLNE